MPARVSAGNSAIATEKKVVSSYPWKPAAVRETLNKWGNSKESEIRYRDHDQFNVRIDSANLLSTFSTMVTTHLPPHSVPSEMINGHHKICGIDILRGGAIPEP